ncbi:MAG: RNA pseudouridine synthase [Planctomycetota bacterium]
MSPNELERRILWEAGGVIAVDKPPDLPTSGRALDDPDCLQWQLLERAKARGAGFVWAVHQLDADTSGVNLFTTERALVARLKRELAEPAAEKLYLAFVHGAPGWDALACEAPIGEVAPGALGVAVDGKPASSTFRVLAQGPSHAAIEARIATGRTHQIRIHLAHLGHPLVGEGWYRAPKCSLHPRQALHARRVALASLTVEAQVPGDLVDLARALGLTAALPTTE